MSHIKNLIIIVGILSLPAMATAQNDDTKKKNEYRVNKLDPIYEEEEFKGIKIHEKEEKEPENIYYQIPLQNQVKEEEDEESVWVLTQDDEGAESEDDIILEGFDTMAIHLPKLNPSSIKEPIVLDLPHFSWPTPITARPSSHFGPRRRRFHYGLDLGLPVGEPIYAAFDGVVRISKYNRSYGNLIIIHHANGLETYYAHMSKRLVTAGEHVSSGQQIGLCGNTGRSFGSHLHFEIRYMGNAMNPENVVDCTTHDLISNTLTLTTSSFRKVAKGGGNSKGGGSAKGGWYTVRKGDNLDKIARRNGTTIQHLRDINGFSKGHVLHVGDRIKVSNTATKTSANAAKNNTAKKTTQQGQTTQAKNKTQTAAKGGNSANIPATYTVRKGDTLYEISRRYGMSVQHLRDLNGLTKESKLHVGQKLKLK